MSATAVATITPNNQPSVLNSMADRYGMVPAAFEATLRATVCKGQVSREEFAAFLLVAKEYHLNPLTKEIYAFPAKGGGIQPIVSIDGWCRIINDHPALDGIEFDDVLDGSTLIAVTCRLYRKDRTRPTSVTEYMSECKRGTDVWKTWPARMLRHKALIQAARYAFGFSGIIDPDEYERMVNVTPPSTRPEVRARLEQRDTPTEGFNAAQASEESHFADHAAELAAEMIDPVTGEVLVDPAVDPQPVDELPIRDDTPEDEFPGDRIVREQGEKSPAGLSLAQRVDAFKKRIDEAATTTKLRAVGGNQAAKALKEDLERADPETDVELTGYYNARMAALEAQEQGQ